MATDSSSFGNDSVPRWTHLSHSHGLTIDCSTESSMQYDIARLLSPETARRLESKFAIDLNGVQLPIHRSRIVLRRIAEAIKVDIFLLSTRQRSRVYRASGASSSDICIGIIHVADSFDQTSTYYPLATIPMIPVPREIHSADPSRLSDNTSSYMSEPVHVASYRNLARPPQRKEKKSPDIDAVRLDETMKAVM